MSNNWQPFCLRRDVARDTEMNPEVSDIYVGNAVVTNFFQSTRS